MNIQYIRSGDYRIPNLNLPDEPRSIDKWGRMHRKYLKEYHPVRYTTLALSGKLWGYLADLNQQAEERLGTIIHQMQMAEGVTEHLKARDWMTWVQHMNSIRARAEEIVLWELIYGEDGA